MSKQLYNEVVSRHCGESKAETSNGNWQQNWLKESQRKAVAPQMAFSFKQGMIV
jgi:hypothetical protein